MKASDLFVRCLESERISHVFGVPGEENADLMMSLKDSSIHFVLTRHEQGAAFMAETFGRLTGHPVACLGTLGPGATNLITGVADANMDRCPMIVITGQGATRRQHKESHQIMDVVEMYRPITKWATKILHPDSIPEIISKAVRIARTEKPGAVLIELSEDVAKADTTSVPLAPHYARTRGVDVEVIDRAFELLTSAKRPIILAGNGVIRRQGTKPLRRFCKLTGIGVVNTFMAKGCVDWRANYALFTIGLQQKDYTVYAIDEADLVISVGYDLVEYPPQLWNPHSSKKILHIDFLPAEVDAQYRPAIEIVGDLGHALMMLNERLESRGVPPFVLDRQATWRQRMIADIEEHKDDDTEGSIRPQKALWDVREALGPKDILLTGVGEHKMWIARYYQCCEPNTCLIPNGFCAMGMPLPGAIAAHLLYPECKIFGIAGDGDFLMNIQEMETARRLNADITIMVWEDGAYGLIAWKQDIEFGAHTDLAFGNPEWLGLARSFGWQGQYVSRSRELAAAIQRALNCKGPSLIVLPIDYQENARLAKRLGRIAVAL